MSKINKTQLSALVAEKLDVSKVEGEKSVSAVIEAITESLSNGDEVALVGFGTFKVQHRAARTGKNPQTGADIEIKATNAPTFKAGKGLKEAVN